MEAKFDGAGFEGIRAGKPSTVRVDAIRNRIAGGLSPVKPLPSDRALVTAMTAGFICLGIACAILIGLKGFHAMTLAQRLADYVVILFCAVSLALALTGEIIPGARRRVSAGFVVAVVFAMTIVVTGLLFPDYSTAQFIRKGVPCLAIGTVCAILAAVAVWRIMHLGLLTDRLSGILTAAMLSGMVGVFALALHCPILNAAHILTWHLGVLALGLAVGALVTRRIEHRIMSGSRESAPS
jgi:hypothetical protein